MYLHEDYCVTLTDETVSATFAPPFGEGANSASPGMTAVIERYPSVPCVIYYLTNPSLGLGDTVESQGVCREVMDTNMQTRKPGHHMDRVGYPVPNTEPIEPPCTCDEDHENDWLEWEFWSRGDYPDCPIHDREPDPEPDYSDPDPEFHNSNFWDINTPRR